MSAAWYDRCLACDVCGVRTTVKIFKRETHISPKLLSTVYLLMTDVTGRRRRVCLSLAGSLKRKN